MSVMTANLFESCDDAPDVEPTGSLLEAVIDAGEDFEWYPTTASMIDRIGGCLTSETKSILDIGAGDGRVLMQLAKQFEHAPDLYSIEKSTVLLQAQPDQIIPVGTDLFEQNLTCIPVDVIFCNPPYSQYETWAATIIESGYAQRAFLVIPQRWKASERIAAALAKRGARAHVIHSGDFHNAERRARAVIDIVEIRYPSGDYYHEKVKDPFDIWFDQNIDTFDHEAEPEAQQTEKEIARIRNLNSIGEMVAEYDEEYARMESNYQAIFKLDYALLRELGVSKDGVREGIKKRMAGLKSKYWGILFDRLDTITSRLSTKTKEHFLRQLTGRTSIAFTSSNAYAVVLWAIKNANKYYDSQLVDLFRALSTFEGAMNYKSNQRTWQKDGWRYAAENYSHYALDYRIVVHRYSAIYPSSDTFGKYEYPGGLHNTCHEQIGDVIAVLGNLGFSAVNNWPSRNRQWESGSWHDWEMADGSILFQVKAHKNGNLHFRLKPEAIKALNVEAGRLLGWLRSAEDVETELGYSPVDAQRYFNCTRKIGVSNIKLLACSPAAQTN